MSFSTVADSIYTYRFLKLLVTPFNKTKAYELGLIDENGKRTDQPVKTPEERDAFNLFHRLVFNLKRLVGAAPGGKTRLASYAAALVLLRENYGVDSKLAMSEMCLDGDMQKTLDMMMEQYSEDENPKKKKKKKPVEEFGTTTADVALPPAHMKFKAFVRRKKEK